MLSSQYEYHDENKLRLMVTALKEFQNYKTVFFKWITKKSVDAEVAELLKQLQEEQHEKLNAKDQEGLYLEKIK